MGVEVDLWCEAQGSEVMINVWHAREFHTGPIYVTGKYSTEYSCVTELRKQRQTGYHSLVIVGFRQCVKYHLLYAVG